MKKSPLTLCQPKMHDPPKNRLKKAKSSSRTGSDKSQSCCHGHSVEYKKPAITEKDFEMFKQKCEKKFSSLLEDEKTKIKGHF